MASPPGRDEDQHAGRDDDQRPEQVRPEPGQPGAQQEQRAEPDQAGADGDGRRVAAGPGDRGSLLALIVIAAAADAGAVGQGGGTGAGSDMVVLPG
jgi:hypothetical protein